jgi:hypothetical protein
VGAQRRRPDFIFSSPAAAQVTAVTPASGCYQMNLAGGFSLIVSTQAFQPVICLTKHILARLCHIL